MINGLSVGGAERNLVNSLNAMRCEYRAAIFLGRPATGATFHADLDPGIEQYFVRVRRRSLPVGIVRLATLLRRLRVNVAHTHMFDPNLYGTLAAKFAGVPVIVTSEHGENPWKSRYHRWLEQKVITPWVDARFCVSQRILDRRRDLDRVPADKLMLLVNGTPLPQIDGSTLRNPSPVIGAVGRFIEAKDYPLLIEVLADLRRRGYRFKAFLVGDGPELARVRALVEARGLGEVVRLPGLAKNMDEWYRRFDIYVSSSVREGQPMALLEAMAYGLPVVTTDAGAALSTVIDGTGGLVVPRGDSAALADALARLLDDPRLREQLGSNARRRIEDQYSVQMVSDSMIEFYRHILEQKCPAR
jgi:glycosyltransferase involved in cell wall biosynthesis